MKQAVAYYRVSTQKQGRSGLGLDAQKDAILSYCKLNDLELVEEVIEVRSTRKCRIGLFDALGVCRKIRAMLIVAKLDRLGRDVEEIARIVKSGVDIVVTDNPHANRLTIHILAAVAEEQRKRISDTTREALQAAKRRGVILGAHGAVLARLNREAASAFALTMRPILSKLKRRGIFTVRAITKELNRKKIPTYNGVGQWHPSSVSKLLNRIKIAEANRSFS